MNQEKLLYAETHEWVAVEKADSGQIATIGITDFAVEQLTDIVFLELPEVGANVSARDEFGEVESVKAVSPIYAPVSGEVIEVNASLPDSLEWLSDDAYGKGWIAKIRISDDSALDTLMDLAAYRKQCSEAG